MTPYSFSAGIAMAGGKYSQRRETDYEVCEVLDESELLTG